MTKLWIIDHLTSRNHWVCKNRLSASMQLEMPSIPTYFRIPKIIYIYMHFENNDDAQKYNSYWTPKLLSMVANLCLLDYLSLFSNKEENAWNNCNFTVMIHYGSCYPHKSTSGKDRLIIFVPLHQYDTSTGPLNKPTRS